MAINLRGRIPIITNPLSSRLIWIAAGIFVIAVVAMIVGFRKRAEKKAAMTNPAASNTASSYAGAPNG